MRIVAGVLVLALAAANGGAPADKYFGRLKLSALRIRYEIAQLKKRYESHKELPKNIAHLAFFTEDAYYQWAAQYPKDSWLASTGINLANLYEDLPGADARAQAVRALTFVRDHFKNTRYSKTAVAQLQHGVPARPYPLWALLLRPSPTPSPSRASPSSSPHGTGSATPRATPSAPGARSPSPKPSPI